MKLFKFKTLLITGGAFIAAGVLAFVVGMSNAGWNFMALDNNSYTEREYKAEAEVTSLRVSLDSGRIKVHPLDADHPTAVVYYKEDEDRPDISVSMNGGELKIIQKYRWNIKDLSVTSNFRFLNHEIAVYLPADTLTQMDIEVDSGMASVNDITVTDLRLDIDSGFIETKNITADTAKIEIDSGRAEINGGTMQNLNIYMDSGTLKFDGVNIPVLSADIDSGWIQGEILGTKADYTIVTDIDSGWTNLKGQIGSAPDKSIFVKIDSGTVNIDFK